MKILDLVEEAEVMILQKQEITDIVINLSAEIQAQHEADLKHAFNRGRVSMMEAFRMTEDEYYTKYYV